MKSVFADTAYWIALLNHRDQLHQKAVTAASRLVSTRIVTTEMVLVELLNGFCDEGVQMRQIAVTAIEAMRRNRSVSIVSQTSQQFQDALDWYDLAADKGWNATDCASFATMEREGIRSALTHDRHFVQAGFNVLLG